MTPPAAQQLGAAVLLQGEGVRVAYELISFGLRELQARSGGVPLSELAYSVLSSLAKADRAGRTTSAGSPDEPDGAGLFHVINTEEAAAMLGVSTRQVRNLADRLGGRRIGGALVFERDAIAAEVEARQAGAA